MLKYLVKDLGLQLISLTFLLVIFQILFKMQTNVLKYIVINLIVKKPSKFHFYKVSSDGCTFSINKYKINCQIAIFKPIAYKDHFFIIFIRKDQKESHLNFYKKSTKKFHPKLLKKISTKW